MTAYLIGAGIVIAASICTEQRTETVSPNALPDEAASFFGVE
jgi:hypothetical protein